MLPCSSPTLLLTRLRTAGLATVLVGVSTVSDADTSTTLFLQDDVFVDPKITFRGVAHAGDDLWDFGIIPIWIDPLLDESIRRSVRQALTNWNSVVGVTLIEVDSETRPNYDLVHVQPGEGCASWVGKRGGAQELWVAANCTVGSITHELGHVIGLEHEHTRTDRDAWISINWDAVREDKLHNFDRAPEGSRLLGEYDYASIMHYGEDYFSADGRPTIEPLMPNVVIGQRIAPSAGDIASVAELYGTDLALSADLYRTGAEDAQLYELDVNLTNEGNRGAHAIEVDFAVPQGWQLTGSVDTNTDWTCVSPSRGDTSSVSCRMERIAAGAQSTVTLVATRMLTGSAQDVDATEASLSDTPVILTVKSRTDDVDTSDNQILITAPAPSDTVKETSPDTPTVDEATPFAVDTETDDAALLEPLLEDGTGGGAALVGGAVNPLWLLGLVLLRRVHLRRA